MQLFFRNELMGYISNIFQEEYWVYGEFTEACGFQKYKDFFKAIICEEGFDESKMDKEFLDNNNWMVSSNGVQLGIYIPAIYEDGEIAFRYRKD